VLFPIEALNDERQYRARALFLVSLALLLGAAAMLLVGLVGGLANLMPAAALMLLAGAGGQALLRAERPAVGSAALLGLLAAGYLALLATAFFGRASLIIPLVATVWLGIGVAATGALAGWRPAIAAAVVGLAVLLPVLLTAGWDAAPPISIAEGLFAAGGVVLLIFLLLLLLQAGALARALAEDSQRTLDQTRSDLQRQIEERTETLALAAAVGRRITRIHDLDTLLNNAAEQIRERFGLYHVQVYLLNPGTQELILRAATGAAGVELLRRDHRLAVGPGSINGTAAAGRQPVVVPQAHKNPIFLPNPLLPHTQSELAVPMMVQDEVIGTLNLQSDTPGRLNQDSLAAFTVLAAQLATAVVNARLFAEITETREQLSRQAGALTREGWSRWLANQGEGASSPGNGLATGESNGDLLRQPIAVRGATIGYMEVGQPPSGSERARELTAAVAGQLGAHLENLRLTQQAEAALGEAQRREEELTLLNQIVTALAASSDVQTSLQLIVDHLAMATGIQQVGVAILNDERTHLTVVADRAGRLNTDSAVGFAIPVENNPATQMALRERRPVVVPNATENPLTASAHEVLRQRGVKTILILPLVVENEVIGTVGLDVVEEGLELTDDQLRLAETIVYQAAAAVSRARLFNQVRDRSRQLESLSRVEADLSLAATEEEILSALARGVPWSDPPDLELTYLSTRAGDGALLVENVCAVRGGVASRPMEQTTYPLRALPLSALWLDKARELLIVENIAADPRLDEAMREQAQREGREALVILPLRRGGQWQGALTLGWPAPHRLTADEIFILQRLHEPLAATIAGRRAYLAQRSALAVTEALYNVSARLNMAQSYDDILTIIRQHTELGRAADALHFAHFDQPWLPDRPPGRIHILAQWSREGGDTGPRRFTLDEYPVARLLRADRPAVFADFANDPRLDRAARDSLWDATGPRSVVFAPLVVGGHWIGYVGLFYQRATRTFAEEEIDNLAGLIGQVSVAAQTILLLEQTRDLLAREARLSGQLRAVSDVGVTAAATLDVDRLLAAAADLTKENFGLYHTHIYLLDEARTMLVLRAGAGQIGRQMVREGRHIPIDATSIVARAARERAVILVDDTRQSTDFLPHPLLPNTRSELAVPLIIGDRLLGVLDVQSDRAGRFQPDDRQVYTILAAQLAVATQNAHYFAEQLEMAEKLREVDRLKTDFLARMSHELRTPLNSIIGFADVLLMGLDGDLTERMVEDMQLIRSSGYHLRDIIGDILDMSKIEAGRLELTYELFDVRRVAAELMATAAPLAEQKGLALRLEIDQNVGALTADRTRVRQVLWNIVGNAIKFTDHGHIAVDIRRNDSDLLFSVVDTGIGIAAEHLPHIFDHFSQIEAGRRESISGTGLGLSISKSLVELHGGRIWVESEPGHGSIFRFTIPANGPMDSNGQPVL
jgi:signal transduction histidine kinase